MARSHRQGMLLCAVGALWLAASPAVPAQPAQPPISEPVRFEGNWLGEWADRPERGQIAKSRVSLARSTELLCNGRPFNPTWEGPPQTGCRWVVRRIPSSPLRAWTPDGEHNVKESGAGSLMFGPPPYTFSGASSELRLVAPAAVRGTWTFREQRGAVTWRRVTPRIARIEYTSSEKFKDVVVPGERVGRVELSYDPYWWGWTNNMRGNRARFHIAIYGENLWGHHTAYVEDLDLEGYSLSVIPDPARPSENGLAMSVAVWPSATPGRKFLRFDNLRIPFDLIVQNFPVEKVDPAKVVRLEYLELKDQKLVPVSSGELRHGSTFYVEATFDSEPSEAEHKVKLTWQGAKVVDVIVKRTSDPKVFRSGPIRLQPPPMK